MSCLFISLAPAVNLHPETLRKAIAAYLKTDPLLLDDIKASEVINWSNEGSLEDYSVKMSRPGVWGGAIEIRAFCELYSIAVNVHVLYTKKNFTIVPSKRYTKMMHISYTGSHFEPMYIELI